MMQISPDGKTVHFEAESQPLFDSEKRGAKPCFVAILEQSQREQITSKLEQIFLHYKHEDFFVRDITGIYEVGRIGAFHIVSFVWLPLSPHDHRDSMHEPGHEHMGDDPFMKDVMKIKMRYAPPQALKYPVEDSPVKERVKKTPHRSYIDTLTEKSLKPPLSADTGVSYNFNEDTQEMQITRSFNAPIPPAIPSLEVTRPVNALVLSTVHHLDIDPNTHIDTCIDTHEWVHFRKDEQQATALLEELEVTPNVYHFTNVKPFAAVTIATSHPTLSLVEQELRNIFSKCPLSFIEEPATRLITELHIRGIYGVAVCDGRDSFNERRGRTIAKGRLAKHLWDVKRFHMRKLIQSEEEGERRVENG